MKEKSYYNEYNEFIKKEIKLKNEIPRKYK
jgi:hypothetical protein